MTGASATASGMNRHGMGRPGLCLLVCLSFFLAVSNGQLFPSISTPLKHLDIIVPEGTYNTVIVQFHTTNPAAVTFFLTGETDGIFQIMPVSGNLSASGSIDRERKALYKLKIEARDRNNAVVEGPYDINMIIQDINDNKPTFNQSTYMAVVRERSRPGKPFTTVFATDADDPATPNAQLFYSIFRQIPNTNNVMLFQINNATGQISTTAEGFLEIDVKKNRHFELMIEVLDLAGLSENALSDTTSVFVNVTESLWKTPAPVEITENSTLVHPYKITQVRCNERNARYELLQKEKLLRFPFSIDQNGDIYVTEPLDSEEKNQYVFLASAKDNIGNFLERPVEVEVNVIDINDNPPVCLKTLTRFEVQENEGIGSTIGTLVATDMDLEPILRYSLLDQVPKVPEDDMFSIKVFTGALQLTKGPLQKKEVPQYNLTVEVSDYDDVSGRGFKTVCLVQIKVIDTNKHTPVFDRFDYGNLTISEDAALQRVILEIQATDADEPFTGSSFIMYTVIEGDPNNVLVIETDLRTNRGYVKINKPLDFETFPEYSFVVEARNPEPLLAGVKYDEKSITRFRVKVTDVDEPPMFTASFYQTSVREDAPVGTTLMRVSANDPEGGEIRYSIAGDTRGWLSIGSVTGDILTAAKLDREIQESYVVKVVASELGKPSMKSEVNLVLILVDVNDNAPRLATGWAAPFFCYPLTQKAEVVVEATDLDSPINGPRFTFSLNNDLTTQRDWEIVENNRTHARLKMKHTDFEMKMHSVAMKIKDRGSPPMEGEVYVPVNVCTCTESKQCVEEKKEDDFPWIPTIIGIVFGVLALIGIIIGAVCISRNHKKKKEKKAKPSDAQAESEMENLGQ
ncbi:cadherin-17 isoform X2 [Ambystoma mexicanum]|uniref:cadherin-17 isoform X2 n=1 Tax=Ambystoma mexicanum TaxID=8296 RepID=UPI0037E8C03A